MWRLIFLGLIVWFAIYLFKRIPSQPAPPKPSEKTAEDNLKGEGETETMVQCATCAVHLPRSEAFLVNNNFYCCKAHIPSK